MLTDPIPVDPEGELLSLQGESQLFQIQLLE